ncbi:MAG: type I-MYXAN CRISPR-associated Cas8a1/Cmx1 [Planctomycetaceae bacterium]|nr:type I-MYXAN CRISPR-associated Cas8a1/Cmx1 [Planctomycetaceae bacterium]
MGRLNDDNGNAVGLRWTLADDGMDLLERAGLAALYMTLRAAEEQAGDDAKANAVVEVLKWDLSSISVEIRWGEPKAAKKALETLFAFAWQIRDGVLYLPAVHREDRQRDTYFLRLSEHNGILNTFLQLDKIQPKGRDESHVETIDEDQQLVFRFQSLAGKSLVPHKVQTLSALFDRTGLRTAPVDLSSWISPGSARRFAESEQNWKPLADRAILLILAPIVCLYQQLQGTDRPKSEKKPWARIRDYLYVCPDIRDLFEFDATRPSMRLDPVSTTCPADAALGFVAEFASRTLRRESIAGCNVVMMGKVTYYGGRPGKKWSDQSVRKGVEDVSSEQDTIPLARTLHRIMPSHFRVQRDKYGSTSRPDIARPIGQFKIPSARGLIAENIVAGRPWYSDLLEIPKWELHALEKRRKDHRTQRENISLQRLWFHTLQDLQMKDQIMALIQSETFTDDDERLFIEAFWDILGAIFRREREAVRKQYNDGREITADQLKVASEHYRKHREYDRTAAGRYLKRRAEWNERVGRMLAQAKTQTLLGDAITILMRYALNEYRSATLTANPDTIRRFLKDRHEWKRALHLARLALATYQPKHKR